LIASRTALDWSELRLRGLKRYFQSVGDGES
jgi:hypothetical protein